MQNFRKKNTQTVGKFDLIKKHKTNSQYCFMKKYAFLCYVFKILK